MSIAKAEHELVLEREFDAPPAKVFKCWTDPELMKQWFVPRPWTIKDIDNDYRPGGRSNFTMVDPDGKEYPNAGVVLEVIPDRRIVTTDAFTEGWIPAGPFMVAEVTFEELPGGRTKYTAKARHWTAEARKQHEEMGFHEGWGQTADQLAELLKSI